MKKTVLLSFFVLFLGLAPHVFAEGFVPLAPIPGLTTGVDTTSGGLPVFFNNLYKYLIGLAAVLAVIQIIWGGLEIAVNKDNASKITDSKGKIYNAIFGLVLVLSPVLVFSIINPSILNLSLNLKPLDTVSGPPAQQTATLPTCNSVRTTNCTPVTPLNESVSTAQLPTCGPGVSGSCVTALAPACSPGQYCYTTTDDNSIGSIVCSSSQNACTSLYAQQTGGGIRVTSACRLCPP